MPGGLFLLPKQNHLWVFPEKPVPAPKASWLEETRPNPFAALTGGSNGFCEKKFPRL
uniref:MYCNsPEP n=1 Tax=Homo sapiens TaxID=9606 RepID=A0A166VE84_HUMAN|nr:MYCNsPEP [Homo sapiens]